MTLERLNRIQSIVDKYVPLTGKSISDSRETVSSTLYACNSCEITYINTEMESCPSCDADVEEIPSESDLGLTSADI